MKLGRALKSKRGHEYVLATSVLTWEKLCSLALRNNENSFRHVTLRRFACFFAEQCRWNRSDIQESCWACDNFRAVIGNRSLVVTTKSVHSYYNANHSSERNLCNAFTSSRILASGQQCGCWRNPTYSNILWMKTISSQTRTKFEPLFVSTWKFL